MEGTFQEVALYGQAQDLDCTSFYKRTMFLLKTDLLSINMRDKNTLIIIIR